METLTAAREGLAYEVERLARLLDRHPDTTAPIPGAEWTVREAAVHLVGANLRNAALAKGEHSTAATADKEYLAARARRLIAENPETDGRKLAVQLRDGFEQLLALTAGVPADQPIAYHAGIRLDFARLLSLSLGECLLHGYDIATAVAAPWPIDPHRAALAVGGYRPCYHAIFQPLAAQGLTVTYGLRTPGTDTFFVHIGDGSYEELESPASLDCMLSADPVTELLLISGRMSQWSAIALGRLEFSGHRPDVGPRFFDLFAFP